MADFLDYASGLFGGVDWSKVILGGTAQYLAARNNAQAAQTSQRGTLQNVQAVSDAGARANERLDRITAEAKPDLERGASHFRQIVAENPDVLTPAQLIALQDAKRTVVNSPVLRTSGRGTTAAVADLTRRYQADAIQGNRARRDQAASQLLGRGNAAVGAQTSAANVDLSTGRAVGTALQGGADTGAAANLATGSSAINVLGRVLAGGGTPRTTAPAPTRTSSPATPAQPAVAAGGDGSFITDDPAEQSPVSALASIIANDDKEKYKSRYISQGAEV